MSWEWRNISSVAAHGGGWQNKKAEEFSFSSFPPATSDSCYREQPHAIFFFQSYPHLFLNAEYFSSVREKDILLKVRVKAGLFLIYFPCKAFKL